MKIDVKYLGKCIKNEGQPNYELILNRATHEKEEWEEFDSVLKKLTKKLNKISNDIGFDE